MREAVEGRGAAADFVEDDEAALGRVVADVRRLVHLDHEGRLPAREIVARADAGEDAIDEADLRARRRAPSEPICAMQHEQRDLPDVGRFAGHVRAGEDEQPVRCRRRAARRSARTFPRPAIWSSTGCRPSAMREPQVVVERRAAVAEEARGLGERAEHIERGDGLRRLLAARRSSLQHFVAQLEKSSYSSAFARSSAPRILPSISFSSGVMKRSPLATVCLRCQCGGTRAEVRFRDLDEVAEDRVVADLERLDAGLLDRALLQLRDPVLALARGACAVRRAARNSRRGTSRLPWSARAVRRRSLWRAARRGAAADGGRARMCEPARRRGPARPIRRARCGRSRREPRRAERFEIVAELRDLLERRAQHLQIARIAAGLREPADGALEVADRLQRLAQIAEQERLARAGRRSFAGARAAAPRSQSGCRIQSRNLRAPIGVTVRSSAPSSEVSRPPPRALHELEIRLRRGVDDHELRIAIDRAAA